MNTWSGDRLSISIFGESHGACVGATIDGLSAGITINKDAIKKDLKRRMPNNSKYATQRNEDDEYEILSGVYDGKTDGAPLTVIFRNKDARSITQEHFVPRPGHADFAAYIKHDGFCDLRGGGHYSARLTAPIVFLGAITRELLAKESVFVGGHILQIGNVTDSAFDASECNEKTLQSLDDEFPLIDPEVRTSMEKLLSETKNAKDTVGACVECAAVGLPIGLGEPFFGSVESRLAALCFSIPSIKAVEFGAGVAYAGMFGSKANDCYCSKNTETISNTMEKYGTHNIKKTAYTNNAGGVVGGMTFGMPLVFRVTFKPIPTIGLEQSSIDMQTGKQVRLSVESRNDVCSGVRGTVIVESVACICLYDLWLSQRLHMIGREK